MLTNTCMTLYVNAAVPGRLAHAASPNGCGTGPGNA
jgi:hypothetical protein